MIAMAIANQPKLLIADEPTTALDVTIQAQVLEVLGDAQRETGAAMLLITHDLGVVAGLADRVVVMYAGRVVEEGTLDEIFYGARHPYTLGLLRSLPRLGRARGGRLSTIPGTPPSLLSLPPGCALAPRCAYAIDACREAVPPLVEVSGEVGHRSACIRAAELPRARGGGRDVSEAGPIVEVSHVVKEFPAKAGHFGEGTGTVHAVDDVSFTLGRNETLGLVGESGCGKSTTARLVLRLLELTSGSVRFDGRELADLGRRELRELRGQLQIVFQDPYASLNPRMRVFDVLAEPLVIQGRRSEAKRRVSELLEMVGLNPEHANRYPHEFSGGQRQRIGIARVGVGAGRRRAGRTGLRVGRLDPSPDPQPARRAARPAVAFVPVHRARPVGCSPHRGPRRGDVSREDRGDRNLRRHLHARRASVHAGAALGRARTRSAPRANASADRAAGRSAERARSAERLSVPNAVLEERRTSARSRSRS